MTTSALLRIFGGLLSNSPSRLKGLTVTATMGSEVRNELIITDQVQEVLMIGINRPEQRNCVNIETGQELVKALRGMDRNDEIKAAVLYGTGGCFCAGYDLQELSQFTDVMKALQEADNMRSDARPMGPSMMQFEKPIIAAVEGFAVAGGLELALMCDMRVVEEKAVMGVFCRRFGVPLLDGGTVRLPALIGLSNALDLILTGRPVHADEAKVMGLANRVVANGTAVGEAVKLAKLLTGFPQECLRADRRAAYYSAYDAATLEDAFRNEYSKGLPVVEKESIRGSRRFMSGVGRHGSFSGIRETVTSYKSSKL